MVLLSRNKRIRKNYKNIAAGFFLSIQFLGPMAVGNLANVQVQTSSGFHYVSNYSTTRINLAFSNPTDFINYLRDRLSEVQEDPKIHLKNIRGGISYVVGGSFRLVDNDSSLFNRTVGGTQVGWGLDESSRRFQKRLA